MLSFIEGEKMGLIDSFQKTSLYKWINSQLHNHSDGISKFIAIFVVWLVALIPLYIASFLYWFISPILMWEILVTIGLLLFFFGSVQFGIGVLAFFITIKILVDDF